VSLPDSFPETVLFLLLTLAAARVTWVLGEQLWTAVTTDDSAKALSHDEIVRVLQGLYESSPRVRASVLESLSGIDPVQVVTPLTSFQWTLVTLWFFFVAWSSWRLCDYFI
jgi:hypothetical protein